MTAREVARRLERADIATAEQREQAAKEALEAIEESK